MGVPIYALIKRHEQFSEALAHSQQSRLGKVLFKT
jgi:hypothetical protein